jgi:hypothetical protein
MTKQEAFRAMTLGHKVTHKYFSSNEYIYMKGYHMYTEEGYTFDDGWDDRCGENWQTGWNIWEEKIKCES